MIAQTDVKPAFKSQVTKVTRESLRFRLTMNIIGISACFFIAFIRSDILWLQAWFYALTLASICGFILSCIDYIKAE